MSILLLVTIVVIWRTIFFAWAKYGFATKKKFSVIKKHHKPKNVFDAYFFKYVKDGAEMNHFIVNLLYVYNILNTALLFLVIALSLLERLKSYDYMLAGLFAILFALQYLSVFLFVALKKN